MHQILGEFQKDKLIQIGIMFIYYLGWPVQLCVHYFFQAHLDGRKLEVKFRPDDQFCKPAISKTIRRSSLILKVKRKKRKEAFSALSKSETSDENVKYDYAVELMGVANKTYQFTGRLTYYRNAT